MQDSDKQINDQPPAPNTDAGGCLPFVLAFLGLAVLEGLFVRLGGMDPESMKLLGGAAGAGLMAVWTYYDAKDRGVPKASWYSAGVFLVGFVVLPFYILKTRGRPGIRLILAAIGVFLLGVFIRMIIMGPALMPALTTQ